MKIEDTVFRVLSKLQNSQNIAQKIIALFFFSTTFHQSQTVSSADPSIEALELKSPAMQASPLMHEDMETQEELRGSPKNIQFVAES